MSYYTYLGTIVKPKFKSTGLSEKHSIGRIVGRDFTLDGARYTIVFVNSKTGHKDIINGLPRRSFSVYQDQIIMSLRYAKIIDQINEIQYDDRHII